MIICILHPQRLEFLGDSVLDHLITLHLYNRYPGMSPGLLTDLRSASVNNDCYSLSAVKVGLQKHILHASQKLHRQIESSVQNLDPSLMGSTFGWESENSLPKVSVPSLTRLLYLVFYFPLQHDLCC